MSVTAAGVSFSSLFVAIQVTNGVSHLKPVHQVSSKAWINNLLHFRLVILQVLVYPRTRPLVLDTTTGLIIGSNRMKMDMGHVREATIFVAVIPTASLRTSVVTVLEGFVLTTPMAALALIKD